ncbi:glycosyltransferase [Acidipila sp. EB88]|uniref:CgeB family protein n=1 Tax=Acidipila sp. EB88 TaxID=2305226 RepID=UPI000F5EB483|nr:glycosyltransferase [Acidipila sp. EB88]RRA49390.1 glycosyltransferase [Acidipila sp. EB88]
MKILILGLTITSSWGNGHATTFRALCRAVHARGHSIDFIEKDVEWYRSHRDLPEASYCRIHLYEDWNVDGRVRALQLAADADVIVIGSYFPDAIEATRTLLDAARCPVTFYDIDTPITIAKLRTEGRTDYLDAALIPSYAAYMSFTSGPMLQEIEQRFGSPLAVPLHCSVDADVYQPQEPQAAYRAELSYLGTYAADRQEKLMQFVDAPAQRLADRAFLVAGPMYPTDVSWAPNVRLLSHVAPAEHPAFYSSARFSLNLTRYDMVEAGYSPSVRLFEAAACGAAILSDAWSGLETFLTPGEEIVTVGDADDVLAALHGISEADRLRMGQRARERILASHTSTHRAAEFERIVERLGESRSKAEPSHEVGPARSTVRAL